MRATLYAAFTCIEAERELNAYRHEGFNDLVAAMGDENDIQKTADAARNTIGEGWLQRQKDKGTYSGLSVRD